MGVRDKLPSWRVLFACLALAGCAGGANTQTCQMAYVTDLKLEQQGRDFYTNIVINGHDTLVQFDTGASDNLITESAAHSRAMAVNVSGWNYVEGVGGSQMTGVARSRDVRLGDAHGERLEFTTVPDGTMKLAGEGVLGMSFLHDFDLDIDFWGGRVGLYKPIGECDAPRAVLQQPLYSVDLAHAPENASPEVNVSINGRALRAVIDTGANQTSIFRDSARRVGLITGEVQHTSEFHGVGPRTVLAEERISAPLVIGDLTVSNLKVAILDQRHSGQEDMLLGYDFVTRVHLWISHSSNTVIMQYPPQASPAAEAK
jgi:clan AA aspartic protease (TIGR02281 family)